MVMRKIRVPCVNSVTFKGQCEANAEFCPNRSCFELAPITLLYVVEDVFCADLCRRLR